VSAGPLYRALAESIRQGETVHVVDPKGGAEPEPQVWCAEHGKTCPYGCIR